MSDPLSTKIAHLVSQFHSLTNEFVASDIESAQLDAKSRKILQKLYGALGIELGNVQLSSIDVAKLVEISDLIVEDPPTENDTVVTLADYYLLLLIYSQLSRTFVSRTIESLAQLSYWDGLHYSSSGKLFYFLQTSPARLLTTWSSVRPGPLRVECLLARSYTEEDNIIYHTYEELRDRLRNVLNYIVNTVHQLSPTMILDTRLGTKSMLSAIYHLPFSVATKDVKHKRREIHRRMDGYARNIGVLLETVPQEIPASITDISNANLVAAIELILGTSGDSQDVSRRINKALRLLVQMKSNNDCTSTQPPGFVTRWWPALLLALNYGPSTALKTYKNWRDIVQWFQLNFVDTVVGFWNNWVIEPIANMMSVLRHDDGSELSITTKESLQSDLDLLERMVVDYVVDYEHKDSAQVQQEIHHAISNGNLTMLMLRYEQDLRSPFKAAIKGSLVRALLIQIQKTKVDGAVAISGIDKLLKSQQLVFGVVSISPSLVILYQAYQAAKRMRSRPVRLNGKLVNILCLKLMNSIEKWLASSGDAQLVNGHVYMEVIRLLLWTDKVVPRQLQEEWTRDLHELALGDHKNAIDRIWKMYGPYLR